MIRVYLLYYYLFINILSFIILGVDKYLAIKHKWRISEKTLLFSFILGGLIGGGLGMVIWHHKTKKWYFKLWLVIAIIIHFTFLYNFNSLKSL